MIEEREELLGEIIASGNIVGSMITGKGSKGDKGDRGESGVWVGSDEPTDPDMNVWIDIDGGESPLANNRSNGLMSMEDKIKLDTISANADVNVIEDIKVNNVSQSIVDKSVNISISSAGISGSYNDLSDKPTIPVVPTNVSSFNNDAGYLTSHQDITGKENTSNKVTTISSSSTNTQYPSAKCVYDLIGDVETLLSEV